MGALEDFLGGIGSIISGIINTALALVNGVVELVQTIIFAAITLVTTIFHALFSLCGSVLSFVMANIAVILLLGGGYFVYTTYVAPRRTRRVGSKKRA